MPVNALANPDNVWLEIGGQVYPLASCTPPELDWAQPATAPAPFETEGPQIGRLSLGELAFSFSPALMPPLSEWVDELDGGSLKRVNLQLIRSDGVGKVQERLRFTECRLGGLHFPECSAASKTPYLVKAVFRPAGIALGNSGDALKPTLGVKTKAWLGANFRLTIGGLPTRSVNRIAAFSLTRDLLSSRPGEHPGGQLGKASFGRCTPLNLSVAGADYPVWRDFALQQVQKGEPAGSLAAQLELLDPAQKAVLGRFALSLPGLSGFRLASFGGAGAEQITSGSAILPISRLSLQINP